MDFLETQASEFRYLTQTAVASDHNDSLSPSGSAIVRTNSAAGSYLTPTGLDGPSSAKRKNSVGSPQEKQQRSKRNRYISIACNECKRRKIRCNGATPCDRCGNLGLQCLYAPNCCTNSVKDSEEFKDMAKTVARLQDQMERLQGTMNTLRSETLRLAPIQDRALPPPSAPTSTGTAASSPSVPNYHRNELAPLRPNSFRGPTSTHFTLDMAKNTLRKMGYNNFAEPPEEGAAVQDDTSQMSPRLDPRIMEHPAEPPAAYDPLWDFDRDEMVSLCRLHEEEMGLMYPVVRMATVIDHAHSLSTWMEEVKKNGPIPPQENGITDFKSLLLKMVMCCALVVQEHGQSAKADKLLASVLPSASRMLVVDTADLTTLPVLALLGGYRFLTNDEVLAWRIIGQVTRICLELGLHRHGTIAQITEENQRFNAIHSFWTAYVLDRRWSLGTGLPYVMSDEELDPELPMPDNFPYLVAMISFSQLAAKIWRYARRFEPAVEMELRSEDVEALDAQIKTWYKSVPKEVQFEFADVDGMPQYVSPSPESQPEYDIQRLQIWTYLRMNQIRIWLYTPVLHTYGCIVEHYAQAELVVKLARNTIKYLTHLNKTTDLYRRLQVFYNQFLASAIAVLFLAACHAPVHFSAACREEFYMALDLVRCLSAKSWVSKRLWRTISSMKAVAPQLGLSEENEDAHSSAALTMAGLATGQLGPTPPAGASSHGTTAAFARTPASPHAPSDDPAIAPGPGPGPDALQNGHLIHTEMSRIFEGCLVGLNGNDPGVPLSTEEESRPALFARAGGGGGGGGGGHGGGNVAVNSMYQHFKEMF